MAEAAATKPLIVMVASPQDGHFTPLRNIGGKLVEQGYDVTFICGRRFQPAIEGVGMKFVPLVSIADFDLNNDIDGRFKGRETVEAGAQRFLYDLKNTVVGLMPEQYESIQNALKLVKEEQPNRKIAFLYDSVFMGAIPLMLNAKGIIPDACFAIGTPCPCLTSVDTAPYGMGLAPDSTPEGRVRNIQMMQGMDSMMVPINDLFRALIEKVGGDTSSFDEVRESGPHVKRMFDAAFLLSDRFIQLSAESFEYPRSDAPRGLVFSGGVPKGNRVASTTKPAWWNEVKINPTKKKIVFVSQGTVAVEPKDLIIPTMEALADRDDVLVIVALGIKGKTLPADVTAKIPSNARVENFIPFDEILELSDVFVTNGGLGGFQTSLSHGCPMVIAGISEDKPEVAARGEYAGVAVNMRTATPSKEALKEGIEKVLSEAKYKEKAMVVKKEIDATDPMSVIEKAIEESLKEREQKKKVQL